MIRKSDGEWEWTAREERPPYRITGKYLFFAERKYTLRAIIAAEFLRGFGVAKISEQPMGGSHVLCLYYANDARGPELMERYKDMAGVNFRWWKSDEDTLAGRYSQQHKEALRANGR